MPPYGGISLLKWRRKIFGVAIYRGRGGESCAQAEYTQIEGRERSRNGVATVYYQSGYDNFAVLHTLRRDDSSLVFNRDCR